ncbi:MAG: T9SS type A sorting domain-containing protein [Bacteroidia bacterium]|nr:T9SS type A sorting domain-containing protein [Bacteroidia bacterium]
MYRRLICLTLTLLTYYSLHSQAHLRAESGSILRAEGSVKLVLEDTRWEQEGLFIPGLSTVRVVGDGLPADCALASTTGITLYQLDLKKTTNDLSLGGPLNITGKLNFFLGNLDLNGYVLDLGSTGFIIDESETHRIMDQTGGGAIHVTSTINSPNQLNPGNIGLALSSSANWGVTTLIRRHDPYNLGGGNSILRSFEISPANNTGLNATFRFTYFDAELNGIPESGFQLFQSTNNGMNWNIGGVTTHNPMSNWVETSGVNAFSLWTTAPLSSFPLTWLGFTARWGQENEQRVALLEWQTAQEQATDFFQIMRKEDQPGAIWQVVGQTPAAGYSSGVLTYDYVDRQISSSQERLTYQYRIRQVDIDGQFTYSQTVVLSTENPDKNHLIVWPNPARGKVNIAGEIANGNEALSLSLTDAGGRQIYHTALPGLSRFVQEWDIATLPAGLYALLLETRDGIISRRLQIEH